MNRLHSYCYINTALFSHVSAILSFAVRSVSTGKLVHFSWQLSSTPELVYLVWLLLYHCCVYITSQQMTCNFWCNGIRVDNWRSLHNWLLSEALIRLLVDLPLEPDTFAMLFCCQCSRIIIIFWTMNHTVGTRNIFLLYL